MKTDHVFKDDALAYLKRLATESAQLVVADPPYFHVLGHDWDRQWRAEEDCFFVVAGVAGGSDACVAGRRVAFIASDNWASVSTSFCS